MLAVMTMNVNRAISSKKRFEEFEPPLIEDTVIPHRQMNVLQPSSMGLDDVRLSTVNGDNSTDAELFQRCESRFALRFTTAEESITDMEAVVQPSKF